MADPVVSVRGLCKKYQLGEQAPHFALREHVTQLLRGALRPQTARQPREFWALRDVSFDVHEGEVVGIIGANGAGKTTLLKILSEITEPTSGEAHLWGRVSSLLEVGIGFHPELTGRENIYLNGAILGMSRAEIRRKFDEIVAFAEVEMFLDTPVKRYSSGMYVRLAFAVAAHLDPDILVVDEVLSVGDAAFQKKCLGKMQDVSRKGRSVLLVSHNMGTISTLCDKALWLSQGRLALEGKASEVVAAYLAEGVEGRLVWACAEDQDGAFQYHSVAVVRGDTQEASETIPADSPIDVLFDFTVRTPLPPRRLALRVSNDTGQDVFTSSNTDAGPTLNKRWRLGRQRLRCRIPAPLLAPGQYFLSVSEPTASEDRIHEYILRFTVTEQGSLVPRDDRSGVIAPILPWEEV